MFNKFLHLCVQSTQGIRAIGVVNHSFHDVANKLVVGAILTHVKQILKAQNVTFTDEHACIVSNCPICITDKNKDARVYINKATGTFVCDSCMRSGPWSILQTFLNQNTDSLTRKELDGLRSQLPIQKDFSEKWQTLHKKFQTLKNLPPDEYERILCLFKIPEVPQEEMAQINCIYDNELDKIYFPLLAFHRRVVGYKSLSTDSTEETVPSFGSSGMIMYRKRNSKFDGTGIVVHTIEDMLALISHKTANVIICLPHNMQHLPQELLPSLEHFKKLILWFGNDGTGWDTARNFAKKLGEKRCFYVRPTYQQPRPKLAADLGYDLKDIGQNAKPIHNESITTFHSLRQDVLSDLQNIGKVEGVKWKRFPALNHILKGHRKGEFTILTGPTGCGKTTFVSEYSLDLAMQGVNTLWGSFEIRNSRLARTMLQQIAGVPLHENLAAFDIYADEFEKLPIYFMTFHGQQDIRVVMDAVEHATYVHDIAHVIIDNVQFMMGVTDKYADRFWDQDRIVAAFRAFATQFNCHVTLVIHPRKEREENMLTTSSIFGSAKASQESDNVLIIQDKTLTSIRGKKYLQVAKNRYSGDLGVMALEFDKAGLSFAQKTKQSSEKSNRQKEKHSTDQEPKLVETLSDEIDMDGASDSDIEVDMGYNTDDEDGTNFDIDDDDNIVDDINYDINDTICENNGTDKEHEDDNEASRTTEIMRSLEKQKTVNLPESVKTLHTSESWEKSEMLGTLKPLKTAESIESSTIPTSSNRLKNTKKINYR